MKYTVRFIEYYILGLIGILFVSTAPAFFMTSGVLSVFTYLREVLELAGKLIEPSEWVYEVKNQDKPILSYLWEPYVYSMQVLLVALASGVFLAVFFSAVTIFLPNRLRGLVKRLLNFFEAIPDLLIAFMIQLMVVAIYKKTEVLVFQFATMGEEQIYFAPILTLSILPMVSLYKVALLLMEEEMTKTYVEFAQSKGIKYRSIILFHVLRNTIQSLFYHSKIIVWSTLSSLLMIEYIFNMNGITTYIMNDFRPLVTAIILWMIFTPFFFFYQSIEMYLNRNELKTVTVRFKGSLFWSRWREWPIWNLLWRGFLETLQHFKNVKFVLGFLVIAGMLGYSLYHSLTADVLVDQYNFIYDENNQLVSAPPHEPKYVFMGTDVLGFSIWDQIVAGAKYTILFAFAVAFLRVAGGLALAVPYAFLVKDHWQQKFDKVVDSLHYLPMSAIALIILQPVLLQTMTGFHYTMADRVFLEIIVLAILALPLVTTLLGNEIRLLLQKEFILGARVLGGNKRHMLWSHLLPHLGSRLGIVFGQQFIQTLIVFIHLGVFGLFVGGTIVSHDPLYPDPPRSYSYEWSGLISSARTALMSGQLWRILPVLFAFVLLIMAMQLVVEGIKDVQQSRVGVVRTERRSWFRHLGKKRVEEKESAAATEKNPFTHIGRRKPGS